MRRNGTLVLVVILAIIALTSYTAIAGLGPIDSIADSVKLGLDIEGGVAVVYEAQTDLTGTDLAKLMDQTKNVLSKRVDSLGLTEPNIAVQGDNRIRIELPGVKDVNQAASMIGKTALLKFAIVDEDSIAYADMLDSEFGSEDILFGTDIKDSGLSYDEYGKPAVSLKLSSEGKKIFTQASEKIVKEYASKTGQIAILLDDVVISAPMVEQILASDEVIITGTFTTEEAVYLASLIRGGALPVKLEEVKTSIIGPLLGKNALDVSIDAAKIGFALVVLFMIGYYRLPGLIASISLVLYASVVLFVLVGLNATLTLPGVAGMVLSIGMAVDANVIIFERIKEELGNGKSLRASVDAGFKRAIRTITDSNVTTLIAAVVLFNFGEGPIQGFAITLMIGIATSMLTAIVITRTTLKSAITIKAFNNKKLFRG